MNRIKELRLSAGLTQNDVAQKLGLNQTAVGKYEREQLEPSLETLKELSLLFDCSIDYLVGHTDDFGNVIKKETAQTISLDGKELLDIYMALSPELRVQVLEYARYFADRAGVKKRKN